MLHAGLDLSRKKLDVCLISDAGDHVDQLVSPPDRDALRTLARRIEEIHREPVSAVIESMTGARFVHDTLEAEGWDVEIADAQKVKGLAPLACKTDKIDSQVLATLSHRDLVPAIWLPDPRVREERELARFRLHLVKHKSALKNRIHSALMPSKPLEPNSSLVQPLSVSDYLVRCQTARSTRRFGSSRSSWSRPSSTATSTATSLRDASGFYARQGRSGATSNRSR